MFSSIKLLISKLFTRIKSYVFNTYSDFRSIEYYPSVKIKNTETFNNAKRFLGSHVELEFSLRRSLFLQLDKKIIWIGFKKKVLITMVLPQGKGKMNCKAFGIFGRDQVSFEYKNDAPVWIIPDLRTPRHIKIKKSQVSLIGNDIDNRNAALLTRSNRVELTNVSSPKLNNTRKPKMLDRPYNGYQLNNKPITITEVSNAQELQIKYEL